ncbi:MAG TPA: sterol desaturase family protein [Myxococcota bacterium]|nr:sterol desaturase family protein [Myxococcota bacterium]
MLNSLRVDTWAAAVTGVLVLDAVSYFWHRANHRVKLLWRFHQVHHADSSFHVTTALRFHPGELLLALPVRLAAILALGVPPLGVLVFEVVFGVANLLEHGNFDLPRRLEPIARRLFITPALHRHHHASNWRDLNSNFGTVFSSWDRLAGTLRTSDRNRHVETGLPGWSRARAPSLRESLLLPFRRGVSTAR